MQCKRNFAKRRDGVLKIAGILPNSAVIIRPAEIIDLISITKRAVLGGVNFRCQGEKSEGKAGAMMGKSYA
jgi:hypothetical protein